MATLQGHIPDVPSCKTECVYYTVSTVLKCHVQIMASKSLGSFGTMKSPSQNPTRTTSRLLQPSLHHSCTAGGRADRAGQARPGQGSSGRVRAGQFRSGQGRAERQGRAGQCFACRAKQSRARQGREAELAGQAPARQGRSAQVRAGQNNCIRVLHEVA